MIVFQSINVPTEYSINYAMKAQEFFGYVLDEGCFHWCAELSASFHFIRVSNEKKIIKNNLFLFFYFL